MCERIYKYYPSDFGKLPVTVEHMVLDFDVWDDKTVADSVIQMTVKEPLTQLTLNAKNLEVLSITSSHKFSYAYEKDKDRILFTFEEEIQKDEKLTITTKTICRSTKNILEGLYYDETPDGAPPQQITQCQQWGFQRIVPCIDDMTAKCTYETSITANDMYTNYLTNGDLYQDVTPVGDHRVRVIYHNTITPMATYLFFLGVGTYATFTREFEYPDGSTFSLELLVPPKSDEAIAKKALEVLHDSILWVYLYTGPDCYQNKESADKLYTLIHKREQLKLAGESLRDVREEIKHYAKSKTWGYKYTGMVYREIGMQNSDFGGMENVGNTTIVTNRIMPYPEMTDRAFEYLIRVKVHEYYHNLNGSEVTGQTPFEIWLNEAVTVHQERAYHEFLFGTQFHRLGEVLGIRSPTFGTLDMDSGVASMPIEPDGFNDPNELITGITYVKAPEFVRMIQTLMGKETFVKGLHLYHSRYKHSNATRAQWVAAMEEASGLSFQKMAQQWLKKTNYPHVSIKEQITATTTAITFKQETDEWHFPITVAGFTKGGEKQFEETFWLQEKELTKTFDAKNVAFTSINRAFTFFGKVKENKTQEQLHLQAQFDDDIVNRYFALASLIEQQITAITKDPKTKIDDNLIDQYMTLAANRELQKSVGGQLFTLFDSVEDPTLKHEYLAVYNARKVLQKAIASKYKEKLLSMYQTQNETPVGDTYLEKTIYEMKQRQVKNACLSLLSALDTEDIHILIKTQFETTTNATERTHAFSLYINSSAKDKTAIIAAFDVQAQQNLVVWEVFLSVLAQNNSDDAITILKKIESSDKFRIEQSNDYRMYIMFAMNKKRSLMTQEGRAFLQESLIKLAKVNEFPVTRMLNIFGVMDEMRTEIAVEMVRILKAVLAELSVEKYPSVCNTAKRILQNSPKSVAAFEKLN
jgi:aminopeptidase N